MKYAILISKDEGTAHGVRSPDVDCVFSFGETVEDAVEGYREALGYYLRDLREAGQEPPPATTLVDTIEVA